MKCVKTGAYVYHVLGGFFARGDAFEGDDFFIFRLMLPEYKPSQELVHFIIKEDDHWWDSTMKPSTMLVYAQELTNLGYEGKPLKSIAQIPESQRIISS